MVTNNNMNDEESRYFHRPLAEWSDVDLIREYLETNKAGFNDVFGGNARRAANYLAQELHKREITQIPNLFGPIEIREWTY